MYAYVYPNASIKRPLLLNAPLNSQKNNKRTGRLFEALRYTNKNS